MSEIEVKITQLREAADKFSRSGERVGQSVDTVQNLLDQLVAMGFVISISSDFWLRYSGHRAAMQVWAARIYSFATRLGRTADDVERALLELAKKYQAEYEARDVPFGGGGTGSGRDKPYVPSAAAWQSMSIFDTLFDPPEPEPLPEPAMSEYVAKVNQPVYEEWLHKRDTLQTEQARLDSLIQERGQQIEDLDALKNRLSSYDGTVDVDGVPRIQTMEAQIDDLNGQILAAQDNIDALQAEVDVLGERLDRVRPGPGADLRLIAELETAQTAPWIQSNTQDCVRHIVDKMAIPGGIPVDAHLWNDMAAQMPGYGITSGDMPHEGAVIVFEKEHSYSDDVYGHLMYVEKVENGIVWITDNNHPDTPVRLDELTDELTGENIQYLYFPWHTRA